MANPTPYQTALYLARRGFTLALDVNYDGIRIVWVLPLYAIPTIPPLHWRNFVCRNGDMVAVCEEHNAIRLNLLEVDPEAIEPLIRLRHVVSMIEQGVLR